MLELKGKAGFARLQRLVRSSSLLCPNVEGQTPFLGNLLDTRYKILKINRNTPELLLLGEI